MVLRMFCIAFQNFFTKDFNCGYKNSKIGILNLYKYLDGHKLFINVNMMISYWQSLGKFLCSKKNEKYRNNIFKDNNYMYLSECYEF